MATIATLTDVDKCYGRQRVVNGVSLNLEPGERLALLGHNGAGKTTLMKLLLGLSRPSAGRVRVLDIDPSSRLAARQRLSLGFLPENVSFDAAMTGRELLGFYARLKRRPRSECDEQLERVGLSAAADRRIATYSKGMRQRLGLAQALLGRPRLLLLDEPTTGLDPLLRLHFYAMLQALSQAGTTVLLSSHALTEIEERTDRIAILREGSLVAVGPLVRLRRQAALPLRVRVRVAAGTLGQVANRLNHRSPVQETSTHLAFECHPEDKMAVLSEVVRLGSRVEDLDFDPPTLDELYTHFVGRTT